MLKGFLILLVRAYRSLVAPCLPPSCRFDPSCSAYMLEALRLHGAFKGSALGLWRILRCNPWCDGGHDPVPPRKPRVRPQTGEDALSSGSG